MSMLVGSYKTKKEALSIAESKRRAGFPHIAVIQVMKSTTAESQRWSDRRATSNQKVKMWEVRTFCSESELRESILDLKED